jgi:AcrR family transcriptional regulator
MSAKVENPRRRLAASDRREQIVQEAIRYFSEVGFGGGTRQLAQRIGVSQPLLYRYFPNKDALIREIYQRVFLDPWRPEWEDWLTDRGKPMRDRLLKFYRQYTKIILDRDWVRIFLFSGLKGTEINSWYLSFLEERLLRRVCSEMRHEFGLPDTDDIPTQPHESETLWSFHGGIFYYCIRREVYRVPVALDPEPFIENSIDCFLESMPKIMKRAIATYRSQNTSG